MHFEDQAFRHPEYSTNIAELWLQQMGLSKQGQKAIKKVREVENEARQNRLAALGMNSSNNLSEPLLDRK